MEEMELAATSSRSLEAWVSVIEVCPDGGCGKAACLVDTFRTFLLLLERTFQSPLCAIIYSTSYTRFDTLDSSDRARLTTPILNG